MRLLGSDGYLEPRTQILAFASLGLCFLISGVWCLWEPSSPFDWLVGFSSLLFVPGAIYAVLYAIRKEKRRAASPRD
jgi:hypothetical protein